MAKLPQKVYLQPETIRAVEEYQARHRDRFRSLSEAYEHLVRRALLGDIREEQETLLVPEVARAIRETLATQVPPAVAAQVRTATAPLVRLAAGALAESAVSRELLAELIGLVAGDPDRAERALAEALRRARERLGEAGPQG